MAMISLSSCPGALELGGAALRLNQISTSSRQPRCGLVNSSKNYGSFGASTSWTSRELLQRRLGCNKRSERQRRRSVGVCSVRNSTDLRSDVEERLRVKQELQELMEVSDGTLTPECLELISTLEKLNPNPEPSKVPELVLGYFQAVKGTLKGKVKEGAGVYASTFTLGRVSLNSFKPVDLEVTLTESYNHIGISREDEYLLGSPISIKSPDGVEPLEGFLLTRAKFTFSGTKQMQIEFLSNVLRPARPENEGELRQWKAVLEDKNSSMDEQGFITVPISGIKGMAEHLYLDEDFRIVKGNVGNITVLRRLAASALPV